MQITLAKQRYHVTEPTPAVLRYASSIGCNPRTDGSLCLPALVGVASALGQLEPWRTRTAPSPSVVLPGLRSDQASNVHWHLLGAQGSAPGGGPRVRALLASEVGCGKTAEALALYAACQPSTCLIVSGMLAKSAVWEPEWRKWIGPQLSVPGEVWLTHFDCLQRSRWDGAPEMLIVDEAHRLTDRHRFTRGTADRDDPNDRLRTKGQRVYELAKHARHVVLLSATPARNQPWDIWGLLRCLDPQLYTSFWVFTRTYFQVTPTRWGSWEIGDYRDRPGFEAEVARWKTCSTAAEVHPQLSYEIQVVPVPFSVADRKRYRQVKRGEGPFGSAIERVQWLRQFTIAPHSRTGPPRRGKEAYARELLHDAGEPACIFSSFRIVDSMRALLGDRACLIIGGQTEEARRREYSRWLTGDADWLLGTIEAGGESIDLTRSRRLILLDLPWTSAALKQLIGRLVRPGQRGPVLVQLLETPDTHDRYMREVVIDKEQSLAPVHTEAGAGAFLAAIQAA